MTIINPTGVMLDAQRTRTHLGLPAGLTFDEWRDAGLPLLEAGQAVMWWIGDWLNYGEAQYGHTYTEAAEWTGMDPGTLANAKWVAGRIGIRLRREDLAFGHHQAVAALESPRQQWFLDRAIEAGWSVQQLRSEVRRWRDSLESPRRAAPVVTQVEPVPAAQREATISTLNALAEGSTSSRRREDSTRVDPSPESLGLTRMALWVTAPVADEAAIRAALERAVDGLRTWFAGEGVDAAVEIGEALYSDTGGAS